MSETVKENEQTVVPDPEVVRDVVRLNYVMAVGRLINRIGRAVLTIPQELMQGNEGVNVLHLSEIKEIATDFHVDLRIVEDLLQKAVPVLGLEYLQDMERFPEDIAKSIMPFVEEDSAILELNEFMAIPFEERKQAYYEEAMSHVRNLQEFLESEDDGE